MFYKFIKSFISSFFEGLQEKPISSFNQTYKDNYNKLWINEIKDYRP